MAEVAWELREVQESSGRLVAWTWEALASCMCVSVTVCSSNWSGVVVLGTHMSRCQQVGRLGSKGQLLGKLSI